MKLLKDSLSHDQFMKWWSFDFKQKIAPGGISIGPSEFYDDVEDVHKNLRGFFNDAVGIQTRIELKDSVKTVPYEQISNLVEQLLVQIGKYFYQNQIKLTDFCGDTIVNIKDFEGMKWAKHISTWMDKYKENDGYIDEPTKAIVNDILSKLGNVWATAKTKKDHFTVTLTSDPRAFCMLSRYGPDNGSCFGPGGGNELHKYRLGVTPNTYVGLIHKEFPENLFDPSNKVYARFFGVTNENFTSFNVTNLYYDQSYHKGTILGTIDEFMKELLGEHQKKINVFKFTGGEIYNNNDANYTYSKMDVPSLVGYKAEVNKAHYTQCQFCRDFFTSRKSEPGRDQFCICLKCKEKLCICEFSKQQCYKEQIIEAIGPTNKKIKINKYYLENNHFFTDNNIVYHINLGVRLADGSYIRDLNSLFSCEECGKLTKKSFMKEKESKKVCQTCHTTVVAF